MKLLLIILIVSTNSFAGFKANMTICHNTNHCKQFYKDLKKFPNITVSKINCSDVLEIPEEKEILLIKDQAAKNLNCNDFKSYWEKQCLKKGIKNLESCYIFKNYLTSSRHYRLIDIIFPEVSDKKFNGHHHKPRSQGTSMCIWHQPVQNGLVESDQKILARINDSDLEDFKEIFISNNKKQGGLLNQWSRDNYLEMIRASGINSINSSYEKIFGYPLDHISEKKCKQFYISNKKSLQFKSKFLNKVAIKQMIKDAKKVRKLIEQVNDINENRIKPIEKLMILIQSEEGFIYLTKNGQQYLKELESKRIELKLKLKNLELKINKYLAKHPILTLERKNGYFSSLVDDNKLYSNQPWIEKVANLKYGTLKAKYTIEEGAILLENNIENTLLRFCMTPEESLEPESFSSCKERILNYNGKNPNKIKLMQILKSNHPYALSIKDKLLEKLCNKKITPFDISDLSKMTRLSNNVLKVFPEYESLNKCLAEESTKKKDFLQNAGLGLGLACVGSSLIYPPFALFCGSLDIALLNFERNINKEYNLKLQECRYSRELCSPKDFKESLSALKSSSQSLLISIVAEGAGVAFDIANKIKALPKKPQKITQGFIENQDYYERLNIATQQEIIRNINEIKKLPQKKIFSRIDNLNSEIKSIIESQDQIIKEAGSINNAKRMYPCLF